MDKAASPLPDAWAIAHAAARAIGDFDAQEPGRFALGADGRLQRLPGNVPGAVLTWSPALGWASALPIDGPQRDLLDLYLPISSGTAGRPVTIGHLGQSLDGFIATHSGDAISIRASRRVWSSAATRCA
jgi:diaminohydroxyphosphoribosylaminopyrimidine deaminase/5-amino-6-(5-phosphoribosylamino)uracil reductase